MLEIRMDEGRATFDNRYDGRAEVALGDHGSKAYPIACLIVWDRPMHHFEAERALSGAQTYCDTVGLGRGGNARGATPNPDKVRTYDK